MSWPNWWIDAKPELESRSEQMSEPQALPCLRLLLKTEVTAVSDSNTLTQNQVTFIVDSSIDDFANWIRRTTDDRDEWTIWDESDYLILHRAYCSPARAFDSNNPASAQHSSAWIHLDATWTTPDKGLEDPYSLTSVITFELTRLGDQRTEIRAGIHPDRIGRRVAGQRSHKPGTWRKSNPIEIKPLRQFWHSLLTAIGKTYQESGLLTGTDDRPVQAGATDSPLLHPTRNEEIMRLWRDEGLTAKEIGSKFGLKENSTANLICSLRNKYGAELVPWRKSPK